MAAKGDAQGREVLLVGRDHRHSVVLVYFWPAGPFREVDATLPRTTRTSEKRVALPGASAVAGRRSKSAATSRLADAR